MICCLSASRNGCWLLYIHTYKSFHAWPDQTRQFCLKTVHWNYHKCSDKKVLTKYQKDERHLPQDIKTTDTTLHFSTSSDKMSIKCQNFSPSASRIKVFEANMKAFHLMFTLVLLGLKSGRVISRVTSCLHCISSPDHEDLECVWGTGEGM